MKGLLVGRINCELPASCHTLKLMDTTGFLDYNEFINQYILQVEKDTDSFDNYAHNLHD